MDDEKETLAYIDPTYIGRRIPSGERRPISEHHLRGVDRRMAIASPRKNDAAESPRCAFSRGISQSGCPEVYRCLESLQMQKNITCGAINIASHKPN